MVRQVHWLLVDDSLQGEDLVFLLFFFRLQDLRQLFSAQYQRYVPADVNFHREATTFISIYCLISSLNY